MSEHIKWTPEQFWEYVEGLAGDFNAGQMREMLAERGLSLAAPTASEPAAWEAPNTLPDIPVGHEREFICAVYRKHSDKVYTFSATYLNAYRLNYEWGCPNEKGDEICDGCEDGCPTTGWFNLTGADDEGSQYHSLNLRDGDELRGWRALPAWDAAPPVRSTATPSVASKSAPAVASSLPSGESEPLVTTAHAGADTPQSSTAINSAVSADRDQIAKVLSVIWLGDTVEWKGFLSKADAFLAYPWPAATSSAMTASAEPVAPSPFGYGAHCPATGGRILGHHEKSIREEAERIYGSELGGSNEFFVVPLYATTSSDAAREAVLAIVKDAFNRGVRSGMKEHTSSNGGNTWVEERPALELRLNAALSAAPVSAWQAPDGWKLVPIVPTKKQLEAGTDNNPTQWTDGTDPGFSIDVANDVYVSMVREAPAPPRNERGGPAA